MRGAWIVALGTLLVTACVDEAQTPYGVCEAESAKGNVKGAASACEDAVRKAPTSKYGKLAADKLKALQPEIDKIKATEKATADAKAAKEAADKKAAEEKAAKEAADRKAAQDAEDAKCKRWMTICTIGRWPDGSEKTTGAQYFNTKSDCETTPRAAYGSDIPCDPCRCMN
jgi:hypothetical protein